MKNPLGLLLASLLLVQPAIADEGTPDGRLDSLLGSWRNPLPGAESLKVVFRKNPAGELVMQGEDNVSSYTLTCHRESSGVRCAGSGTMRADGQPFIYRCDISLFGGKITESWRVNRVSSPDDPPVNYGYDELVREK